MSSQKHYRALLTLITCLMVFIITDIGFAVMPPRPDVEKKLKEEGRFDEYMQLLRDARSRGMFDPPDKEHRFTLGSSDAQDTFKMVVLLADFSDQPWTQGADGTQEHFEELLFSLDTYETGSLKDFYLENSLGDFVVDGHVYGWYRMPQTYAYYVDGQAGVGQYPQSAAGLVVDAIEAADDDVDFSQYDNGDLEVDALVVVHSGPGRETSGSNNDIHSHMSYIPRQVVDGVAIQTYSIQPEEEPGSPGGLVTVGVFCHEQGHLIFGLPDLYDTDYSSEGVGYWSLMAAGSWNGGGTSPSHFDAWCKIQCGFVDPIIITENEMQHEIPATEYSGHVLKLWKNGNPTIQYFLVENRQQVGFDAEIPGSGLMIYHVDDTKTSNDSEPRYLVSIEQADGKNDLENSANDGDTGDVFPGATNNREFSDRSNPNSISWSGLSTEVAVWDISDSDSIMTANIDVVYSQPYYTFVSATVIDEDSIAGLGETVDYSITILSNWADASEVAATLTCDDPRITIDVDSIYAASITGRGEFFTPDTPFKFTVPEDMDTVTVKFNLTIEQDSWDTPSTLSFMQNIGGAKVLIVDDDEGKSWEDYYTDVLDSTGYTYDVWNKYQSGTPDIQSMKYPFIIWLTGQERLSSLTEDDIQFMKDYIDFGGGLFLSGQDLVDHAYTLDPDFVEEYLECSYGGSLTSQQTLVFGDTNSFIGNDGMVAAVNQKDDDNAYILTSPDWVTPNDESDICFRYIDESVAGLEIDKTITRIVLFTFGLECINDTYGSNEIAYDREELLSVVMGFLNGRQAAPNKPPASFSLTQPDNGDDIEGDKVTLYWHGSSDDDLVDSVLFRIYLAESDTSSWDETVTEYADTQYTFTDLTVGSTYYWKIEAYDPRGASTFSSTYKFQTITDVTPPVFTISLLPNPVLPYELDVFAYTNEDLSELPELQVQTPTGGMDIESMSKPTGREFDTYIGDYTIGESGSYTVSVCGTDVWDNNGCTDLGVSAARMRPGESLELTDPGGEITIRLDGSSATSNGTLLIYDTEDIDDISTLIPTGATALKGISVEPSVNENAAAELVVDLTELELTEDEFGRVAVLRISGDESEEVTAFVDPSNGTLTADATLEGEYVVALYEKGFGAETEILPTAYKLYQNHPNPFNPDTKIQFDLPGETHVQLEIFNVLGRRVTVLADRPMSPGTHVVTWDGRSESGDRVASGIYFYRIKAGSFVESRRMVLLK